MSAHRLGNSIACGMCRPPGEASRGAVCASHWPREAVLHGFHLLRRRLAALGRPEPHGAQPHVRAAINLTFKSTCGTSIHSAIAPAPEVLGQARAWHCLQWLEGPCHLLHKPRVRQPQIASDLVLPQKRATRSVPSVRYWAPHRTFGHLQSHPEGLRVLRPAEGSAAGGLGGSGILSGWRAVGADGRRALQLLQSPQFAFHRRHPR